MYNAKLPIPPGFVVTAQAYEKFVQQTGIQEQILSVLKNLNVEDNHQLSEASKKIGEIILNTQMLQEIKDEIIEAYESMNIDEDVFKSGSQALDIIKTGREPPFVAVRSSATAEDLPTASFAGQQATYLNIKGSTGLLKAVQKCWASLFTARAIYYRVKNNFPHEKVLIAVVVQKMVDSEKAGVMFSSNPVTNNEKEVMIEAGFGLGEAVVSGSINPDQYIIDKQTFEIKSIKVNKQDWEFVRDPTFGKTVKRKIEEERQEKQVLDDIEITELAKLAVQIEQHYGKPQDLEFATEGKHLYIVQSRPITTLKKVETKETTQEEEKIEKSNMKEIVSGISASPGIASGPVKIVTDIDSLDKIQEGDVLVAEMTNPDYVSAMKKSSAIVTDQGGSTCFSGDTKVLTTTGFITIKEACEKLEQNEEIKVLSMNPKTLKSEWKKAINPIKRTAKTWEITVSQTGRSQQNKIRLTPDHKMFSLNNREIVEEKLCDLLTNQNNVCIADFVPPNQNPHVVDDPKLAYVCGSIFSDGYIQVDNRRGRVVFTQKEIESKLPFIEEVKNNFYDTFEIGFTNKYLKRTTGILRGKKISGEATDFVCSRKLPALKLKNIRENMVDWVLHLNEESLKKFIAGALDGDGTFNITHESGRIHIYASKKPFVEGLVLAFLRLGILPQLSVQRENCFNIQVTEKVADLLNYTKRVKGNIKEKILGTKLLSAKQIIGDIIEDVNWKGKIRPYVQKNLLLDVKKLKERVLPLVESEEIKKQLMSIINADFRMQKAVKTQNEQEEMVYNFEVENNHTYTVFTENYTPLIVWNCHAAIVGREMGIPVVVGTETATSILKDGMIITVDASKGKVYEGKVAIKEEKENVTEGGENCAKVETVTEIKVIMDLPDYAEKAAKTGADGVGLLRGEFINLSSKVHPVKMIQSGRKDEFVNNLKENMIKIAKAFEGKPVWYRTLDAPTDEFRQLEGGEDEPHEDNPMMGWRSIRRGLDQPELLKAEFEAIKKAHDEGYTNLGIMIPLVTHVEQIKKSKELLREVGLEPLENIDFGVMVETPAAVQIIEEICEEGIDFVSFGTNDLTQFTLAVDRNNAKIQKLYDELHPAVLRQIKKVITTCKRYNVETSICGQAGSKPEMAEFLVKAGIDSISANPDSVHKIRNTVAKAERKLLLSVARKDLDF